MKEEILRIASDLREGSMTTQEQIVIKKVNKKVKIKSKIKNYEQIRKQRDITRKYL